MSSEKLTLTERDSCTIREALTIMHDNKDFYKDDIRFQVCFPSAMKLSKKLDTSTKIILTHDDLTVIMLALAVAIDVLQEMKADGTHYLPVDEVLLTDCIMLDERLAHFLELQ